MASRSNSLRVVEKSLVSPPPGTPAAALPLTFFDVVWLYTGPVERLFFYPSPHPADHFNALESSLTLALGRFPLLAGRVRPSPLPNQPLEIQYQPGDSVTVTLAECDDDFTQLSGSQPCDSSRFTALIPDLINSYDGTMPLLATQVTVFPGSGLCLAIAVHHVACDDSSSMQFVKSWAMASKSGEASDSLVLPFYDRNMVMDPKGLYFNVLQEMECFKRPDSPPTGLAPSSVFATFTLDWQMVEKLKVQALARATHPFHCSSFVVCCAYVWACLLKAQGQPTGGTAHLLFSVDCRARLSPPLPAEYFGNCLRPCFVKMNFEEDHPECVAAEAIGRAVEDLGKLGLLDGAEGWLKKIVAMAAERAMSVAGSPKHDVYDIDFGWGRPANVKLLSILKTPGTISLARSKDGAGGIEIGLALPTQLMHEFASSFRDGLNRLDQRSTRDS